MGTTQLDGLTHGSGDGAGLHLPGPIKGGLALLPDQALSLVDDGQAAKDVGNVVYSLEQGFRGERR